MMNSLREIKPVKLFVWAFTRHDYEVYVFGLKWASGYFIPCLIYNYWTSPVNHMHIPTPPGICLSSACHTGCQTIAKGLPNRLICQLGVNCERATAVNLPCAGCLWCHAGRVKCRLLFWFVLCGHESVKELIRAGEKCITLSEAQMEATQKPKGICEKWNHWMGLSLRGE